jgi:hypothetical protein
VALSDLRASLRSLVGAPPREAPQGVQVCAMCGLDNAHVTLLMKGAAGYVCSTCAPTTVFACAGQDARGHGPCLAEPLVHSLESIEWKTPWAEVEPLLDAAMLLVGGDANLADRLAAAALRFQHYARAFAALDLVPLHARTVWNRVHRIYPCLMLEDRARVADDLAALDGVSLSPAEMHYVDIHRAWAASRFETPGQPSFTMDRERVIALVAQVRRTGPPMLLARALEALAGLERTRDPGAALAHVDEASSLAELPSVALLRGDLLADRALSRAREAWERARSLAHPEGIWAARAAARLERIAPANGSAVAPPSGSPRSGAIPW